MEYLHWLKDLFLGSFISFGKYIAETYHNAIDAGLAPDWFNIIKFIIIISILLGSAFFTATIAEMKNRNRLLHFFAGLFIPWIYPFIILFYIPKTGVENKKNDEQNKDIEEETIITDKAPEQKIPITDEEEDTTDIPVISKDYIKKIATDDLGNSRGPFIFLFEDGKIIEVAKIIEALPQHVVVEIQEKENFKTIRFPYSKINAVVPKEEWDPNNIQQMAKTPEPKHEQMPQTENQSSENANVLSVQPILVSKLKKMAKEEQKSKISTDETARLSIETMQESTHIGSYVLLKPGTEIGGCKIISEIGKGGMGMVYLARHTRLDVNVAIKVISAKSQDENDIKISQRFLQEAKIAAKIRHPHIVSVMDAGKDETNQLFYIVMEYMDGGNVGDLIRKNGRISQLDALYIISAVTEALAAGQKFDIVHRDIKPDNIMLTSEGDIKLSDLGLAKINEPRMELHLTGVNMVLGSIPYMSPEQARDFTKADFRSDVYSLGASLFHMLTGQFPYNAENPLALIMKAINDPIPNPKDLCPDIYDDVAKLCMRMMAKTPQERFQTPEELLQELNKIIKKISS